VAKDTPAGSGEPEVTGAQDAVESAADAVEVEATGAAGADDIPGYYAPGADVTSAAGEPETAAEAVVEAAEETAAAADEAPVGEVVADAAEAETEAEPEAEPEAEAEGPAGDRLGADLPDPGSYTLAPDETDAEELDELLGEDHTFGTDDDGEDAFPDEYGAADEDEIEIDDADQLEEATEEAAHAPSTRPVRKTAPTAKPAPVVTAPPATAKAAAVRKNRPTRTRAEATAVKEVEKTTPALFVSQVVQELKKVVWPTGSQLRQFFIVVLAFVLFMIVVVSVLDLAFGRLMLKVFGG
jgi:preprotein translocase SecE subunit